MGWRRDCHLESIVVHAAHAVVRRRVCRRAFLCVGGMTDDEIMAHWYAAYGTPTEHELEPRYVHESVEHIVEFARAVIAADRAQRKPMQNDEVDAMFAITYALMLRDAYINGVRDAESVHGIGAKDD